MDHRDTIVLGFARKEGGIVRSWHRRYFVIKTRLPDTALGHGWQGPGATKPDPNATVTGNPHPPPISRSIQTIAFELAEVHRTGTAHHRGQQPQAVSTSTASSRAVFSAGGGGGGGGMAVPLGAVPFELYSVTRQRALYLGESALPLKRC